MYHLLSVQCAVCRSVAGSAPVPVVPHSSCRSYTITPRDAAAPRQQQPSREMSRSKS